MCKPNQIILPRSGRFLKMLPTAMTTVALGLLFTLPVSRASAQTQVPCTKCPANAQKPAVGSAIGISVIRNGVEQDVTRSTVGACETLIIDANVSYNPNGPQSTVGAGFSGGQGFIKEPNGTLANVTPADMATTLVGVPGNVGCPGAVGSKDMTSLTYTLTPADIAAGSAVLT